MRDEMMVRSESYICRRQCDDMVVTDDNLKLEENHTKPALNRSQTVTNNVPTIENRGHPCALRCEEKPTISAR
jgi:hypothetical protein